MAATVARRAFCRHDDAFFGMFLLKARGLMRVAGGAIVLAIVLPNHMARGAGDIMWAGQSKEAAMVKERRLPAFLGVA